LVPSFGLLFDLLFDLPLGLPLGLPYRAAVWTGWISCLGPVDGAGELVDWEGSGHAGPLLLLDPIFGQLLIRHSIWHFIWLLVI
jgi:hypothetical protein